MCLDPGCVIKLGISEVGSCTEELLSTPFCRHCQSEELLVIPFSYPQ